MASRVPSPDRTALVPARPHVHSPLSCDSTGLSNEAALEGEGGITGKEEIAMETGP